MSSSDEEGHVFYRERPEWKDVTPIPSDEGADPVVSIDYSEQFADVYDYIRGVIKSGERSKRVLALTEDAIRLNAANYTVWQLRRDVIDDLKLVGMEGDCDESAVEREFNFCHQMIMNNQKNYQVWHHRKAMVMAVIGYDEPSKKISSPDDEAVKKVFEEELRLTKELLSCDSKNYHAWQHRQWILSIFRDFSTEMEYINSLLVEDVRNNSAWNQRHFVFVNIADFSREAVMKELDETWTFVKYAPSNESPWSYLRGLISLAGDYRIPLLQEVASRCRQLTATDIRTVPHLALFIETLNNLIKHGQEGGESGDVALSKGDLKQLYDEGIRYLELLITTIDPIRKGYWEYVMKRFVAAHSKTIAK